MAWGVFNLDLISRFVKVKGVDYGITVGVNLKNSGDVWFDLVVVAYLGTLSKL